MRNPYLLAGVILLCGVMSTRARLGETPQQIAERYGPVRKTSVIADPYYPSDKSDLHEKNGIAVYVTYEDGRAVHLRLEKVAGRVWSDDEVTALLTASWEGRKWSQIKKDPTEPLIIRAMNTTYTSPDPDDAFGVFSSKTYKATWWHDSGQPQYVEITTAAYEIKRLSQHQEAKKEDARRKLKGF